MAGMNSPTSYTSEEVEMIANTRAKIAAKLAEHSRAVLSQGVDVHGMTRNTLGPNITSPAAGATIGDSPSTLGEALVKTASTLGANLAGLMDSVTFTNRLAAIDPDDPTALATLVSETLAANPQLAITVQRMARNPAQGASASPVPSKPKSVKDQLAEMLSNKP